MRFRTEKPRYYQTDETNSYCFFQPEAKIDHLDLTLEEDTLPNPLDRFRAPVPRLLP